MIKPAQAAPMGKPYRVSSDSAWPLRGLDGKTFAERRAERDAFKAENERLRDKLSALSSYVGAGIGEDSTTPEQFDERIRWGIDHLERVAMQRAASIIETCSQKPSTTWGEVKRAILDAALEPRP